MISKIKKQILGALSLTVILIFVSGCGKTPTTEVRAADGNNGNNDNPQGKPTFDVAPNFAESQLRKGQWIEWKRTSATGVTECIRWEIAGFVSSGIQIEGRFSRACEVPDNYMVEHILFRPDTGLVVEDVISTPNSNVSGPLLNKSIYSHLYGSKEKVDFLTGKHFTADKKFYYPVFQLKNKSQLFLIDVQSPFHGFVLKWGETIAGTAWSYELKASNPAIEVIPVSP